MIQALMMNHKHHGHKVHPKPSCPHSYEGEETRWRPYSMEEDCEILDLIDSLELYDLLRGRYAWELLSKEELGGEKPTDLLRRMKKLLGDKYTSFDKELFLQLFYQRLPPDTQRCLFTVKNKLSVDELATLADEFMATLPQDNFRATDISVSRSRNTWRTLTVAATHCKALF
ncbi:hypothetical protein O3P69_016412 [Scylla paramamosain]|uniref:Uncharacterized protein n=1 Tax=Scylla paramamosain TaxID=85552 RepID=A0AAW0TE35_SCYPA